jgi:soluble lytic murein transglycosylase-like protein
MRFIIYFLILVSSFLSLSISVDASEYTINEEQAVFLALAHEIGSQHGIPETLQMIVMQETLAGKLGRQGDSGKSLGVMQIQVDTAKFVARVTDLPELPDEAYHYHLTYNDHYAMTVAAKYFNYCLSTFNNDWRRALIAYNAGISGSKRLSKQEIDNHDYLKGVQSKLPAIKAFNMTLASASTR